MFSRRWSCRRRANLRLPTAMSKVEKTRRKRLTHVIAYVMALFYSSSCVSRERFFWRLRRSSQVTISGAAKVATTKKEFMDLKAAQARSDIREKFDRGMGEVNPEVRRKCRIWVNFPLLPYSIGYTSLPAMLSFYFRWPSNRLQTFCGFCWTILGNLVPQPRGWTLAVCSLPRYLLGFLRCRLWEGKPAQCQGAMTASSRRRRSEGSELRTITAGCCSERYARWLCVWWARLVGALVSLPYGPFYKASSIGGSMGS